MTKVINFNEWDFINIVLIKLKFPDFTKVFAFIAEFSNIPGQYLFIKYKVIFMFFSIKTINQNYNWEEIIELIDLILIQSLFFIFKLKFDLVCFYSIRYH